MADASEERPAPSAIGTLESRPLVHLLVYARNRRLSGCLELRAHDGRSGTIELWRGRIRGTRTAPPVAYLGAIAYEQGLIETATLDSTLLEIAKSKRLHGEVLVERGAITAEQRDALLVEQSSRKMHHLFSLPPDSTFAFYEQKPSAEEPTFTVDPIRPAWRGLRDNPPNASVREVLDKFASSTLRMANEGPVGRAGLDADEEALCDALTWKPMTIGQLRATSKLPAPRVDLLVYLLVITKCAEPTSTSSPAIAAAAPNARPSSGSLPAVSPSEPRLPAAHASQPAIPKADSGEMRRASLSFKVPTAPAFRSAGGSSSRMPAAPAVVSPVFSPADLGAVGIAHRASVVNDEDPFTVLGLPEGAPAEAARAAYFRLAKLWHPERLPEDLAPFRSECEHIFVCMTEANKTLTDPELRAEYLATGKKPGAEGSPAERPRRDVLRDLDGYLSKREFAVAEIEARELAKADPTDSEAQAIAAWASTMAGEAGEEILRAAVPLLDKAINNDRDCERAIYYRGILHKRLGSGANSYRDFTRVVQLNPKHVDAQREVRLFEMRARKGSGEHALDALIAKAKKR